MTEPLTRTWINVYEIDRVYGGPEEGGWYYTSGTLVASRRVAADVPVLVDPVVAELEELYPNTGNSSSVLYRGGDYSIYVEDHAGRDFPEEAPRYE